MARLCGECGMDIPPNNVCPQCGSIYEPDPSTPHGLPRGERNIYLGDAVYADIDDYGVVTLRTDSHDSLNNVIVFEPTTLRALMVWLSTHGLR